MNRGCRCVFLAATILPLSCGRMIDSVRTVDCYVYTGRKCDAPGGHEKKLAVEYERGDFRVRYHGSSENCAEEMNDHEPGAIKTVRCRDTVGAFDATLRDGIYECVWDNQQVTFDPKTQGAVAAGLDGGSTQDVECVTDKSQTTGGY